MNGTEKRKSETSDGTTTANKKVKQQWRTPKKSQQYTTRTIEPGDAGIWATCELHKEGKSTGELQDLFNEHAAKLYGDVVPSKDVIGGHAGEQNNDEDEPANDIEADIYAELEDMKSESRKKEMLFQPIKVDVQCVLFFKTRRPVEPVSFVNAICESAAAGRAIRRCRFVQRLTPMTRMGKATAGGLEEVAQAVLAPVFHAEDGGSKKFAIRPTIRNHGTMKRDEVIKKIASLVGPAHSVDLKKYDVLILVDIYKNMLGMSVVGNDYERLKRYNIAEIINPTPKDDMGRKTT